VQGARVHNLKNVSLELPRDSLIVLTGLSGSGKSSLAFDTIYAEGQRRYVESLSAYARQFLGLMEKPDVDHIDGRLHRVGLQLASADRTKRAPDAGPEQSQVIVDLGGRANRGARRLRRVLLLDRDGRRKPVDGIHVGLLHPLEELSRVRR